MQEPYHADRSLQAKLRRRLVRAYRRRPARLGPARPMISFSFDDAPRTALNVGAKLLETRGVRGTYFLCAGLAGRPSPLGDHASEDDIRAVASAGHEIACHSFSHLDCGRADRARIEADVGRNAEALEALGGDAGPATFAYPYGDAGFAAKRALADRFALCRGVHPGLIRRGSDLAFAPAVGIEGEDGEVAARTWMARAKAETAWLILYTHGVTDTPSPYDARPETLERLIDAAIAEGFEIVTVKDGARRMRGVGG